MTIGKRLIEKLSLSMEQANEVHEDIIKIASDTSFLPLWAEEYNKYDNTKFMDGIVTIANNAVLATYKSKALRFCALKTVDDTLQDRKRDATSQNIQYDRETLAERCVNLSDYLIRLARTLREDKPHGRLCINDLGEIQASGTIIDALCGRLMGKIHVFGQM